VSVYSTSSGRFRSAICVGYKQIYLGTFDSYAQAESARVKAESEYRGEFKCGEIRPIPGFDGYYATSDGQVLGRHGRPLAFHRDPDGYKRVSLAGGRGAGARRVHRGIHQLVCLAFKGVPPPGLVVRHIDGTRDNNVPDNVAWGTLLENSADRIIHGTRCIGERSVKAKLKDDDVYSIRCYLAADFTERELAQMFGVSQRAISFIKHGRTWKHVTRASWQKN
jgi:hypothetical protein